VALAPGTRLGPYELTAHIGAGGMGEVYRARDTRLDRIVAIKISHESFSERFDREARAVATLNHPRICTLFDVGPDYLVMEYVEGAPLQGPMPLERALTYGAQICEALDAAHRKGITHRDLKPGNILVTKAGVKLLDFGLAKIEPAVAANEAAMTRAVTQQGQILGTLHYMSPEQLQGQDTGPVSDVFAFGLVLYEMLTGKRAFDGASPASVIAAILERPAPSIADVAPPALDRTLRRCLEKDPERRWQSAADLKAELEWIAAGGAGPAAPLAHVRPTRWPWVTATSVLVIALAGALWAPWRKPAPVSGYTFTINPPDGARYSGAPYVSPDGTRLAFVTDSARGRSIEVQRLDTGTSQSLPGTRNASSLSWSPDSRSLTYVDQTELKRIDVDGGVPIKIGDFPPGNLAPFTSSNDDGVILHTGRDGLYALSTTGGSARRVTMQAGTGPQFLPDGKHFLYWNNLELAAVQNGIVYIGSIDAPPEQNQTVFMKGTSAVIFGHDARGDEYLLFARGDALMAQAFDSAALKTVGPPQLVSPQIGTMGPVPAVSVSKSGVLAFTADVTGGRDSVQLTWFDRKGTQLADAGAPGFIREFSLSPNESQAALSLSDRTYDTQIYVMDVTSPGAMPTRITFDRRQHRSPIWSPDGARVVFSRLGVGLVEKSIRGDVPERVLAKGAGRSTDWSRDGRTIVYAADDDLMLLTDGTTSRFRQTEFSERHGHLSPDGRLLAYTSTDAHGVLAVYVETVAAGGAKWQIVDGGFQPRWRSDGRELFFIRYGDAKLMAVPVAPGADIPFGAAVELFNVPTVGTERGYAVTSNGQRFLVPRPAAITSPTPFTVMTHWTASR